MTSQSATQPIISQPIQVASNNQNISQNVNRPVVQPNVQMNRPVQTPSTQPVQTNIYQNPSVAQANTNFGYINPIDNK